MVPWNADAADIFLGTTITQKLRQANNKKLDTGKKKIGVYEVER